VRRGGARLMGATTIIGVDAIPERVTMARALGVDHTVDFTKGDPVKAIMALTDGRGVDVAIEALGMQTTFEGAMRVLRPGGTMSSLGVYSSDLRIPLDAFAAGLGDTKIITTLCPGGKERMRRLMDVGRLAALTLGRWSRTASSSTRSRRPTSCSPISATACSRWRSRFEVLCAGAKQAATAT